MKRSVLLLLLLPSLFFRSSEGSESRDAGRLQIPIGSVPAATGAGLIKLESGLGFLYRPPNLPASKPVPLLILLHPSNGAGGMWFSKFASAGSFAPQADALGCALLAPQAPGSTWGEGPQGFGPGVSAIDRALAAAFAQCPIDRARISLAGFSDGASYALSVGLVNGDQIGSVIAFSPGFIVKALGRGRPRILIAHGRNDPVLPYEQTDKFVRQLRQNGYSVEFRTFEGGHELPRESVSAALRWLAGQWRK